MATHSSILAWRIPWTEEPGGLQSMRSQRVGPDWSDLTHTQGEKERKGKEKRTVGQMVFFLFFSSCLALPHSRMLCFHPSTHIPISNLCSLSLSLGWKGPEVVIHRRLSFCNLSFRSILLAFRIRDKEHGHFLFNTCVSYLPLTSELCILSV